MQFVVSNPTAFDVLVADLGLTISAGEERDLLEGARFSSEALALSSDLSTLLVATTLNRLTGFGGTVIPAAQAFDDQTTEAHIADAAAHGLAISVLANVTDAGSGVIINTSERTKLDGIEAGAEVNDTGAEIVTKLQGEATPLPLDVDTVDGADASALRDRATHTGTQTASTISDFDSAADARITLQKGAANGIAELDGTGNIPAAQLGNLPPSFTPKGNWDASTNTPTLNSGVGTEGDRYRVSVAGTTNLDGETDWQVGDEAYFASGQWWKADNSDAVTSVNGATGAVVLDTDDVSEGATNLYYSDVRVAAAPAVVANTAKVSADGPVSTHSDVDLTGAVDSDVLTYMGGVVVPVAPPGESSQPVCQARLSTSFDLTTGVWVDIPFDIRDEETVAADLENPAANPERIVVNDDTNPVELVAWIPWSATSSDNFSIRMLKNGSVVVPGSEATVTTFDDFDPLVVVVKLPRSFLSSGDYFTVQMIENVGAVSVNAGATFQATQLKGPRGAKGDTGSGSTITIQNDGAGLGTFDTINFGEGLTASDAGGGTALVLPTERYMYRGKTTNTTITGITTVEVDELVRDTSSGDFTYSAGEFTCNFTGWIEASFDVSLDCANNNRETSICWIELNGVSVDHSDAFGYHRNNANGEDTLSCQSIPIQVTSGDVVRVRANDLTAGTLTILANGCRIKLKRA